MHLLDTYALSCGLKVAKPFIYEKYVPLDSDKYISFHKHHYPYFSEVINLIKPTLDKHGIGVIQLKCKTPDEQEHVHAIADVLSAPELAYVIRNSLLHFGEDSFLFDFCGHFEVPFVALFSNVLPNNFAPYWNRECGTILQTTGQLKKPTYSPDPKLNFVKNIHPEAVAAAIMEKLKIDWVKPYETVFIGEYYRAKHDMIEFFPKDAGEIKVSGFVATTCVRMDYNFNEQFLAGVLGRCKSAIITNKTINMNLLNSFKANINEIMYIIDENVDLEFARDIMRLNIPHAFVSQSTQENFEKEKQRFFEISHILHYPIKEFKDIPKLESGVEGLLFKSSKRLMLGGQEFKCQASMTLNTKYGYNDFEPCIDSSEFRKELEFFHIVKPLTSGK